jgi:hypothetical protein
VSSPGSKPLAGSSSPDGHSRRTSCPSAPTSVSFSGLNVRSPAYTHACSPCVPHGCSGSMRGYQGAPAIAKAVTSSGEVTNACVERLPSLRAAKLRL